MNNYEKFYKKISDFFNSNKKAYGLLKFFYRFLILPFVISYFLMLYDIASKSGIIFSLKKASETVNKVSDQTLMMTQMIIIPATIFIVISILRLALDAKRPYEIYDIKPLINKNKKGQSMPSRHVLSAAIISTCLFYLNPVWGIVLFVLTIFMAITRVLAGVHFIKDVLVAIIIGILCSYIGLWMI